MAQLHRRQFIKTLAAAATVTIAGTKSTGRVLGANDALRIGVAGLNGRGSAHVSGFLGIPNVQITYLIDPDTRTYAARAQAIRGRNAGEPRMVADVRQALEDRNLDAISIATPNHWHALMTVWGAQAGKHVYVEKPCSHNVKEGRIAVEMARRHNVIVQHGTQSRSGRDFINTIEHVRSGRYGRLLVARGLCYKLRPSIGQVGPQGGQIPSTLDYNLWCGPAPLQQPLRRSRLHYDWHWTWDYGNGDIGNQGVHEMDKARWAIAGATLPRSVICVGGRFGYTDDGETPNTQIAVFDYGPTQLIFEVRGLPSQPFQGEGVGNLYHCEEGTIAKGRFFPRGSNQSQPLPQLEREPAQKPGGGNHFANFIAAVRSGRREDLNADILEGHYSSSLCHLANISYRLGENAPFNPRTRAFGDNREAYETLERMQEHLGQSRNVALDGLTYRVGRKLEIDVPHETFVGNEEANRLLTRPYRAPFVVPDRVG